MGNRLGYMQERIGRLGSYSSEPGTGGIGLDARRLVEYGPVMRDAPVSQDKRPVYLIAHKCNDPWDIEKALKDGANAIEFDVRCSPNAAVSGLSTITKPVSDVWNFLRGKSGESPGETLERTTMKWVVDHDVNTSAVELPFVGKIIHESTQLAPWLEEAARCARSFGAGFAALYVDIKTPEHMSSLYPIIRAVGLPSLTNVIYSTADFDNVPHLDALAAKGLSASEGVMIDEGQSAGQVLDHFQQSRTASRYHHWYGYGLTSEVPFRIGAGALEGRTMEGVEENLRTAIARRDNGTGAPKVVVWTARKMSEVADYFLNFHVDGVMVEKETVADAAAMIRQSSYMRLATSRDPAFTPFKA
jgi:hypothetical protein